MRHVQKGVLPEVKVQMRWLHSSTKEVELRYDKRYLVHCDLYMSQLDHISKPMGVHIKIGSIGYQRRARPDMRFTMMILHVYRCRQNGAYCHILALTSLASITQD